MHSTYVAEIESGQRALAALRVAIHKLCDSYKDMGSYRRLRADYPFCDFFEDEHGRHELTYYATTKGGRVFRARLSDGRLVLVKFSVRYSEDAHRAACRHNFAPTLYAVNRVYDWYMIVMEDKSAVYSTLFDFKRVNRHELPVLMEVQRQVKTSLTALHKSGYVHGDVRDVNVLVRNAKESEDDPYTLLVDWEWAGPIGNTTYPANMSHERINRPPDALGGTKITTEHDLWMVNPIPLLAEYITL
jgi:hypothetical protein